MECARGTWAVIALMMLVMRWLDPTAFIAIPLVFLPLADPLMKAGYPPLVIAAPLLLCSAPFWMTYMNFWIAMGDGISAKQGWDRGQLFWMSTVYSVGAIIATILGVFYWRMIGVM